MKYTENLLRKWVETAPQRHMSAAQILRDAGLSESAIEKGLKVKVGKPEADLSDVPTFDPKVTRPTSPMLLARFRFAGTITDSGEKWLSVKDMRKAMAGAKVLRYFNALKRDCAGSAPAQFPKRQLALFSVQPGAEENQTYLVWTSEGAIEPKLYRYVGQSERIFENLDAFLDWAIGT